jgi:uncharacterized protein (DUF433 family)
VPHDALLIYSLKKIEALGTDFVTKFFSNNRSRFRKPIQFWEPILDDYAVCRLPSKQMDYKARITLEPGKRSGKPCIRGMRITVQDVLGYLAAGMTQEQILADFPYLEKEDILACLAYAADSEKYSLLVR